MLIIIIKIDLMNFNMTKYQTIKEYLEEEKCTIITPENELNLGNIEFIGTCGHNINISFKLIKKRKCFFCYDCIVKNKNRITPYETILNIFKDRKCNLITPKDKYVNGKTIINYIAECGHENKSTYDNFKKIGNKCNKCSRLKPNREQNLKTYKNSHECEANAIDFLFSLTNNNGRFKKTFEKCKVDLLFKPTNDEQKWLPLQIKSRSSNNNNFNHTNNYDNMILILICLETKKIWMINSNEITAKTITVKSNITSKYNKYLINENNVFTILCNLYQQYNHYCGEKSQFMIPQGKNTQKEYKLIKMKKKKLKFLKFKKPRVEHKPYDYTIKNYKIQDKTAYIRKDRGKENLIRLTLKKNIGSGFKGPYEESDFDYLWINLPNKLEEVYFYLIPSQKLIELEILKTNVNDGKTSVGLYPLGINNIIFKSRIKTLSLNDYLFKYDDVNESTNLFI